MAGAPTPQTLLEAIAADADPIFITSPMPETPTGTLAASIQGGFPAVTMTNELAGGKPPLGQDMNGFFNLVSGHTVWVEAGQFYPFNAGLAAELGGYALGSVIAMADGSGLWICLLDGTQVNPDTTSTGNWAPLYSNGIATVPVTGGTVNLTQAQSKKNLILLTGVLVGNLAVNFPNAVQEWLVINATTGAFTTTLKTSVVGSVGVVSNQGGKGAPLGIYAVGDNNIYPTVAPLSVPIDQAPNPLTIVERTNTGVVTATQFNQTAVVSNPTIGSVFVQNVAVDGFLRAIGLTDFEAQLLLQGLGGQLVNGQVPFGVVSQWAAALFTSPVFTGFPSTPTPSSGDSSSSVASTQFVNPASSLIAQGSRQNADGSIDKWGTLNIGDIVAPTGGTINFPVPFPNACFDVQITGFDANLTGATFVTAGGVFSAASFSWFAREIASAAQNVTITWRAIGR